MRFFVVVDTNRILDRKQLPLIHEGGDTQTKVYINTYLESLGGGHVLTGVIERMERIKNSIQHRVWKDYSAERRNK